MFHIENDPCVCDGHQRHTCPLLILVRVDWYCYVNTLQQEKNLPNRFIMELIIQGLFIKSICLCYVTTGLAKALLYSCVQTALIHAFTEAGNGSSWCLIFVSGLQMAALLNIFFIHSLMKVHFDHTTS